ncbi:jerky protein homolog-like [Pieris rapae]|uniref:jerky protein homolog-like n=1 Tax=Pieris rapae TaxID=64459 RepID=UPI000B9294E3|nr:jerky protein homolog-like [Pieris rapae]
MLTTAEEENIKVLEEALCTWILQKSREKGDRAGVSHTDVVKIVSYFKSELQIGNYFCLKKKWLDEFKERHKVYIITNKAYKPITRQFQPDQFVQQLGLHPSQIYIADEAGLYWRFKYSDPLEPDLLTFLTCANISGLHKLQPFVIGKIKNPPSLEGLNPPIVYSSQKDGLMTRQLFSKWFKSCFVPEVEKRLSSELDGRAVLVIDSAIYHPQPGNLLVDHPLIEVLYIPLEHKAEKSSQNVFNYIKRKYKDDFLNTVLARPINVNNLTQFNVRDMAYLLADCWSSVPQSMFGSWWNLLIALDGSSSVDSPTNEDVQSSLINRVCAQFDVNPAIMNAWYEGVCEDAPNLLTDYEILQNAVNMTLEGEDEEESSSAARVGAHEAFTAFELCLRWAQENGYAAPETTVLREMKAKALSVKENEPPLKCIKIKSEDEDSDSSEEVVIIEGIKSEFF